MPIIPKDFESLTKELDERAEHDVLRDHYYKEGTITSLFEEEKVKFLELPDLPYEVFKFSSMGSINIVKLPLIRKIIRFSMDCLIKLFF